MNILNPDNFKKWIKDQNEKKFEMINDKVGSLAETKLSLKRLVKKIDIVEGKANKLAKDFFENGGTVKEILNEECLIEVKNGCFYIEKKYIIF